MVGTFNVEGDGITTMDLMEGAAVEEVGASNIIIAVDVDELAGDGHSTITLPMTTLKYWEIHRRRL